MAKINLRDIFPFYTTDCFVEVSDGDKEAFVACLTKTIADVFVEFHRAESAYLRKMFRYNAHYSLDCDDGIEKDIISTSANTLTGTLLEDLEPKVDNHRLHAAMDSLPAKQAKRIYAHYFLGMSKADIARAEGVAENAVKDSIRLGIKNMKNFLENFQ